MFFFRETYRKYPLQFTDLLCSFFFPLFSIYLFSAGIGVGCTFTVCSGSRVFFRVIYSFSCATVLPLRLVYLCGSLFDLILNIYSSVASARRSGTHYTFNRYIRSVRAQNRRQITRNQWEKCQMSVLFRAHIAHVKLKVNTKNGPVAPSRYGHS